MYTNLLLITCFIASFNSVSQIAADKHTGLCPSGYPRLVNYENNGKCYPIGQQGPCGKLMTLRSNPYNPGSGYCWCKDVGSTNCLGRPLLSWPSTGRCYFAYSQGPCRKGHWLILNKYGNIQCQKNPCPITENQRRLNEAETSTDDFYFSMSNKCYMTGTRAFCKPGEKVYFVGSDIYPRCFSYKPWKCGGGDSGDSAETGGGFGGFGIATDDI